MEQNGETWRKFPFDLVNVDEATEKRVTKHFKGPLAGLLLIGPEKWIMSKHYVEHADDIHNFVARHDDIYISTYPRSGTTLTQEMMWLIGNDLNYEAAKETDLDFRFPFLEMLATLPKNPEDPSLLKLLPPPAPEILKEMTSQRFIKTHLPIKLMPYSALDKECKIVYVARNPKDVIVSCFHFAQNPGFLYDGTFEQFVEYFMDDLVHWGPYFEHIKDGWRRRNDKNVLFLFYEDLIMDLPGSLKKIATFLDRPLSDNDLPDLMNHLNINNFKQNTSLNKDAITKIGPFKWDFIRRGQIGGNPEMTPEIDDKIDEWTEKQLFGSDLKFPHQLRHKMEMYKLQANRKFKK